MASILGSTELQLIRVEIFWLSLVGVWLLYGLLALWLSKRTWHWFISFSIIATAVSALRLIEAGDLMLMQLANSLTIFFVSRAWKRIMALRKDRQENRNDGQQPLLSKLKSKLSLANLLILVAAIAILLSLLNVDLTDLEPHSYSLGFGIAVGFAFMVGLGIGTVPRWWTLLATLPVIGVGIYVAYFWIFPVKTKSPLFVAIYGTSFVWSELELFARAVLVAAAVSGWVIGLLHRTTQQRKGSILLAARMASVLLGFFVCLQLVAMFDVGSKLAHRYPNPESRQQNIPNELADIVRRFATSQIFDTYPPVNDRTLQGEVTAFATEFSKLPELLVENENAPTRRELDMEQDMSETQNFRTVARALSAKSRLEFADGSFDQALTDSIQIVRLRKPLSNKMTLISELVAIATEGIGHFSAAESIGSASRPATNQALQQLLELDSAAYDPEQIYFIDREVYWNGKTWWGRLADLCDEKQNRGIFDSSIMDAVRRGQATRQQTIAMLALELYRHDNKKFPEQLEDLVPRYLGSVPHDPFRGDEQNLPLCYQQLDNGKDYLLYSMGLDRNDDEGRVSEFGYGNPGEEGEDLNLREAARLDRIEREQDQLDAAEAAAEE